MCVVQVETGPEGIAVMGAARTLAGREAVRRREAFIFEDDMSRGYYGGTLGMRIGATVCALYTIRDVVNVNHRLLSSDS